MRSLKLKMVLAASFFVVAPAANACWLEGAPGGRFTPFGMASQHGPVSHLATDASSLPILPSERSQPIEAKKNGAVLSQEPAIERKTNATAGIDNAAQQAALAKTNAPTQPAKPTKD